MKSLVFGFVLFFGFIGNCLGQWTTKDDARNRIQEAKGPCEMHKEECREAIANGADRWLASDIASRTCDGPDINSSNLSQSEKDALKARWDEVFAKLTEAYKTMDIVYKYELDAEKTYNEAVDLENQFEAEPANWKGLARNARYTFMLADGEYVLAITVVNENLIPLLDEIDAEIAAIRAALGLTN